MFKTVRDLKTFIEDIPDDMFVCPVSDHDINGQHIVYGIIFDDGGNDEIIFHATKGIG